MIRAIDPAQPKLDVMRQVLSRLEWGLLLHLFFFM